MKQRFLETLHLEENYKRECKLAENGLPVSIWETYSSFANTEGGVILLGVREHRDSFEVNGLTERQLVKYQKDFWSVVNDRNKVSKNILLNHHVAVVEVEGKKLLQIEVPEADRHDKPVYIGPDPMKGTYRRNYEGDYLCAEEEIRAMFADQREVSVDSEILEKMTLDALNVDTIKGYRIRFKGLHENHPWNKLQTDEFLMKLKAVGKNKEGNLSPTVAGLLMFGEAEYIQDVFSNYFLDYREETENEKVRWLYRTTSDDGDWSGNLYDFYYKVINRIDDDVAVPFVNRRNGARVDEVDVHEALAEAVANAFAHADYKGRRGIVIVKNRKKITIANPGTLRVSREDFFAGGNSDPRNPLVLKMLSRVNVGERAGSGIDKIMTAWREQNWKKPEFITEYSPDRVIVKLEVGQVVYIPGAADLRGKGYELESAEVTSRIKEDAIKYNAMSKEEQILSYLQRHGEISMGQATELCGYKTKSAARKLMEKLREKNRIERIGSGPMTRYRIKS